jgi:hypothetical protein
VELQTIGAGMTLVEMLLATDDRWWSLMCADPNCCAAEGSAREVGCSVVAAEAVVAGLAARSSRDDLASILDPRAATVVPVAELASAEDRITRAILSDQLKRTRLTDTRAIVAAINRSHKGEPNEMTSAQAARFATALTDIGIRDELWLQIDERSVQAGEFMLGMLRRLPAPYDAPPLFLFGWDQWRAGNGIVAAMAAERAMDSDPDYSAANLLLSAVRCGLDPRTTPVLRDTVSTS